MPKYTISGGGSGSERPAKTIMDFLTDGYADLRDVNRLSNSTTSASQLLTIMGAKRVDEIEASLRNSSLQSKHDGTCSVIKSGAGSDGGGDKQALRPASDVPLNTNQEGSIDGKNRDAFTRDALKKLDLLSQSLSRSQMGLPFDQETGGITYQRHVGNESGESHAARPSMIRCNEHAAQAAMPANHQSYVTTTSSVRGINPLSPLHAQHGFNRSGVFAAASADETSTPSSITKVASSSVVVGESLESVPKDGCSHSMVNFQSASHSPTSFLPTSVMKQMHSYRNSRDGRGSAEHGAVGDASSVHSSTAAELATRMVTQPLSVLTSREDQHCNQSMPFPPVSFHPGCQNQMSPQEMARAMQQRALQEQLVQQHLFQQRFNMVNPMMTPRNNPLYMQFVQAQAMQSQMAAMHHRPRMSVQSSPVRLNSSAVDVNMLRHRAPALSPQQQYMHQIRMRNAVSKGARSSDPLSQLFTTSQRFPMPLIPPEAKAITLEDLEKAQKQAAAQQ
ncbi:unnamed protein product [Soboliphyme baturini]|uniref:Non-specific serine/threonine protein kinase n=1 Tax=Soboliphyme baturini TaxID=241478 RepID=A0A183IZT1_9BILA|nr:unnamed protein product [Soboliphyme baturini]